MGRTSREQFGDYRLVRLLGVGGFAEVYEADHIHLPGIKAAIKLLKGSFTPQQIEDLRREALIVSKLDHPHVVQLRTFSIEHNIPYLVMAYAQRGALSQHYPRGTRIPLPEILGYVRPVAEALQYAHEQRVIHRDLKPANVLLTQDGRVQVADFGIAVVSHNSMSRTLQEVAGTWVYMAPEQFQGLAEPASDQYSLAIMVYQWLCGTVPFDGNGNLYMIPQQQKEQMPPPLQQKLPDLPLEIEEVVMKALAKDPKDRFASIQEFAERLSEASRPRFVPAPGQCLGDYRLVRKLGEGGFAEVYEAEHLHLGTKAAIKLLKGTFTPTQVEGLRQEARAIIQLDHQHIIRAYGFSIEGKTPYLIMAYASGGSLATRHEQGTPLPLTTIREYVRQVASALQYAHDRKIVHRDIKPENILLAQDGHVLVADFGIAVMAQTTQAAQEIVGSWTYMAPEQFTGQAEPASDQYALGIIVYQWLSGEPPFTGKGSIYALPYQHMNESPPSLCERIPTLSPRIEQVVLKALAKKPEERFTNMHAFVQALEEASTPPAVFSDEDIEEGKKAEMGGLLSTAGTTEKPEVAAIAAVFEHGVKADQLSSPSPLLNTDDAKDLIDQGISLIQQSNFKDAMVLFEEIARVYPDFPEGWVGKGICSQSLGGFEEAILAYEQAIKLGLQRSTVWRWKGDAYRSLQQYPEALSAYEEALILDRNDSAIWNSKGDTLADLNMYNEALLAYEQALVLNPNFVQALHNKGAILVVLGKVDEALVTFDKAIDIAPGDVTHWYGKGFIYEFIGKPDEALSAFDQALAIDPLYRPALEEKKKILIALKRHFEAIKVINRLLFIDPQDASAWHDKGKALLSLDKAEAAIEAFDRSLALDANQTDVWYVKGLTLLYILRNYPEALIAFNHLLALKPDYVHENPDGKPNLDQYNIGASLKGFTLFFLGQFEEANSAFDDAIKILPEHYYSWKGKMDALRALGRHEEAVKAEERVYEIAHASKEQEVG